MPYAYVSDMITRFGVAEMIRLSVPSNQPMEQVNSPPIDLALGDASDLIDTYVSKRYQTPMTNVPPSIVRAACYLARYDLSTGDGRDPSEQVRLSRKEVLAWLQDIGEGRVLLPLDEVPSSDNSYAQMSDRGAVFGPGIGANIYPNNGNYPIADQGLTSGEPALDNPSCDDVIVDQGLE